MIDIALAAIFMVIGYLLGTIPTGYLVARMRGVDIQEVGSGNIGATNVLRAVGPGPAILVALFDPLKGILAVLFPILMSAGPWTIALAAFATVLGNNFNIFLQLRGGKGVATSLGVFIPIDPLVTLLAALLGIFTMAVGRFVSLGSLVGVLSVPLMLLASLNVAPPFLYLAIVLNALIMFRHRDNIRRLAAGTERRLGEKATPRVAQEQEQGKG